MEQQHNTTWGPAMWSILHHCTERIGMFPSKAALSEEKTMWVGFLQQLQYTLPCIKCRPHYTDYFIKKGLPDITKEGVRRWLYELHTAVNERLGKPNIAYEELEGIYSQPFSFREMYQIINHQLHVALRLKWISLSLMERMLHDLNHFRRFYQLV